MTLTPAERDELRKLFAAMDAAEAADDFEHYMELWQDEDGLIERAARAYLEETEALRARVAELENQRLWFVEFFPPGVSGTHAWPRVGQEEPLRATDAAHAEQLFRDHGPEGTFHKAWELRPKS